MKSGKERNVVQDIIAYYERYDEDERLIRDNYLQLSSDRISINSKVFGASLEARFLTQAPEQDGIPFILEIRGIR